MGYAPLGLGVPARLSAVIPLYERDSEFRQTLLGQSMVKRDFDQSPSTRVAYCVRERPRTPTDRRSTSTGQRLT